MAAGNRIGLTLGPLLYLWDQPSCTDFYSRIADEAEVDTVVLGEIVCSKRDHFHAGAIERIAERLTAAGKRVRLGSPALVRRPAPSFALRSSPCKRSSEAITPVRPRSTARGANGVTESASTC